MSANKHVIDNATVESGYIMSFYLREGEIFAFMNPPSQTQMRYTNNRFKVLHVSRHRLGRGTHYERVVAVDEHGETIDGALEFDIRDDWIKRLN